MDAINENKRYKMKYAPIALFTYNRPDKTKTVIESLLQNAEAKDSEVYIFSDGAKNEKAVEGVKANREYLHSLKNSLISNNKEISVFKSITIIEREKNWGLANSLIAGITDVINKYGRVIVVEDDLILSPYFLKFMNDGLEKYKDEDKVGAISGFVYPVGTELPNTFFLKYFNCWGWAIWKRSWNLLNLDTKYLLRKLRFHANEFDYGGNGAYGNLYCQKIGIVNSWWVRLYASLFLANKLTLYPSFSLVANNGSDGSGTHSGSEDYYGYSKVLTSGKSIEIKNSIIEETKTVRNIYIKYFNSLNKDAYIIKQYKLLKSFIRRLLYIDCI